MPDDHRARVEELVGDYRRGRERLAEVQRELMSISESATSQDGLVTATVGPHGVLVALVIAGSAYQRYRPSELAGVVVRLTGQAAERAARRAADVMAEVLPSDCAPEDLLAGRTDLRPEDIAVTPPKGRVRPDEEDSFEHRDWLDMSERGWPA